MKNTMKYSLIVAMVLIGAILLVSGNAGAVIVAPQPASTVVVGSTPAAMPVPASGIVPAAARSGLAQPFFGQPLLGFPFFRPFFGFPFFNPFIDVDPFFGLGVNPGFID